MPTTNLPEFRHLRSGSLNNPPQNGHSNGIVSPMAGQSRFDGPKSPPNTSHVPCKFFRQGTCQAGNACPFSHDIGAAAENVCKYFSKGNCKFGPKCANIHVLPDGRRINYGKNGINIGNSPINLGSRVNPTTYHHPSNSALTNSFMRADNGHPYSATGPFLPGDERHTTHQLGRQPSMEINIDTAYSSNPASAYGSPRDEEPNRFGLGLSPVNKVLGVMDVPLPASFDSNGISHAARYGPWPASVPSKFGLESPSPSLTNARDERTSDTLKALHSSAFGSSEHLTPSNATPHNSTMGSSPPSGEEFFGKRAMHSSSLRYAKPRLMSSSAPKVDRDWDPEFMFSEEDCVPDALANEVLTPQEKARRGSLRFADGDAPPTDALSASLTKFGSPVNINAASPSRWDPIFQRQREEKMESGSLGKSMKFAASAFGHVGSPLRNSSLAIDGEVNGTGSNGRPGSGTRSGSESLSVLTQQLQRTRISEDGSAGSSPHLHPNSARTVNGPGGAVGIIGKERDRERGLERHVSSGSIGSSVAGRFATPIEEEDSAFVFSMEEEEESSHTRARKRISGGLGAGGWSYAGIVAGKNTATGKGREATSVVEGVGGR